MDGGFMDGRVRLDGRRIGIFLSPLVWLPVVTLLWVLVLDDLRMSGDALHFVATEPRYWLPPLVAGALGVLVNLRYSSPVLCATVQGLTVVLLPALMESPLFSAFALFGGYWLVVAVTTWLIARGRVPDSVFQRRLPALFDTMDEDDD